MLSLDRPCLAFVLASVLGSLAGCAPDPSPAQPAEGEPPAAIVGYFEQQQRSRGGIGHSVWFRDDGTMRTCTLVLVDSTYEWRDGQLVMELDGAEGICDVEIQDDRAVLRGALDESVTWTRLPGSESQTSSIVGAWSYPHHTGSTAYVRCRADGRHEFRMPLALSIKVASFAVSGDALRTWNDDDSEEATFALEDGQLRLTDHSGRSSILVAQGEAPWFPLEPLSEQERDAAKEAVMRARETPGTDPDAAPGDG